MNTTRKEYASMETTSLNSAVILSEAKNLGISEAALSPYTATCPASPTSTFPPVTAATAPPPAGSSNGSRAWTT